MQGFQGRFDLLNLAAQQIGHPLQIPFKIAGSVEHIDQMNTDQALGRVMQRDLQLLHQMLAQRDVLTKSLI